MSEYFTNWWRLRLERAETHTMAVCLCKTELTGAKFLLFFFCLLSKKRLARANGLNTRGRDARKDGRVQTINKKHTNFVAERFVVDGAFVLFVGCVVLLHCWAAPTSQAIHVRSTFDDFACRLACCRRCLGQSNQIVGAKGGLCTERGCQKAWGPEPRI